MMENRRLKQVCMVGALLLIAQCAWGKTIYVDAGATGGNTGESWADAYIYLQDAIGEAVANDEIHVAAGTYRPDQGVGYTPGDRDASFVLKNLVKIMGGYAPGGSDTSNWEINETFLSGDLLGDDDSNTLTANLLTDSTRAENSYHVITGQLCGPPTVLDGLTITAGNANGINEFGKGGGWYNTTNSSPTVNNCVFEKNAAALQGGGLYNKDIACKPPIANCEFKNNLSGVNGGGISCESNTFSWIISNCDFYYNVAANYGGGMYFSYASPTVEDCEFTQNKAYAGGGLFTDEECNITLKGCVLKENITPFRGGALYNNRNSSSVKNCEFSFNSSDVGGAVFNVYGSPITTDTIFRNNTSVGDGGAINNYGSSSYFSRCYFLANATEAGSGGAIANLYDSNPSFYDCVFIFNESMAATGGAMYNANINGYIPDPKVYNCTLYWNTAWTYGGGIYSNHSNNDIYLTNCILWNNVDTNGTRQDLSAQIHGSTYHAKYSCIQGWSLVGDGNINTDPMFVNPAGEDYMYGTLDDNLRLQPGSPCIDAGEPSSRSTSSIDLSGCVRVWDDPDTEPNDPNHPVVDMGAYEFDSPSDGAVVFCDANLKKAIEDALGVSNPTAEDMKELISLNAISRDIKDLCGLEYAINLKYLNIKDNQVTDLDEITGLTKLVTLYATYNDITTIPDLSNLTSLNVLYLYNNQIDTLCPLANSGLTGLTEIKIKNNKQLTKESYQTCIPQIIENNSGLVVFEYDPNCQNNLRSDANGDCLINLEDFAIMANEWLVCDFIYQELCP